MNCESDLNSAYARQAGQPAIFSFFYFSFFLLTFYDLTFLNKKNLDFLVLIFELKLYHYIISQHSNLAETYFSVKHFLSNKRKKRGQ